MTRRNIVILSAVAGALALAAVAVFVLRRRKVIPGGSAAIERAAADLAGHEGVVTHLYLDTKGLPTTGIGHLVKSLASALALPWQVAGRPATPAEVSADFAAVSRAAAAKPAGHYAPLTKIRLARPDVVAVSRKRLETEFVPALQRQFPNWTAIPGPAQVALLDMIYSLGAGGLAKFNTMIHAVQRGDYRAAALASQRAGARESRNTYVRDLFLSA